MRITNVKVFQPDGSFVPGEVAIEDGRFVAHTDGAFVDGEGCYAIPGLVDIHFHGCVGHDFCDGTNEAISALAQYEAKCGVTAICPATMTYSEEILGGICDAAAAFRPADDMADLVGINLEGPFIAPSKKGAQNPAYLQLPNVGMVRRLKERSGGLVKLLDMAPELEGAMEAISELKDEVRISLAHTAADYDTAMAAFQAGAKHVTHLYNAMNGLSHRSPGLVGAAFDGAETAELICDGVHIHPAVVRTTFQVMGPDRLVLISDSVMATGLDDGDYTLGGQAIKVVGNLATLADGTIAGSATNLMDCMKTAVLKMGVPFGLAVKAASVNPAKAIGVYDRFGSIETGKVADLVLLDRDLNVKQVYLRGKALL